MHDRKRPAPATEPIHELILHRWSPRAFDSRAVEPDKLRTLFEAARWSASSYNAQPWYFIVGTKSEPENYKKVLDSFVEFNQGWAKSAPVVALSVAGHKMPLDQSPRVSRRRPGRRNARLAGDGSRASGSPDGRNHPRQGPGNFRHPAGFRSCRRIRDRLPRRSLDATRGASARQRNRCASAQASLVVRLHRQVGRDLADREMTTRPGSSSGDAISIAILRTAVLAGRRA